MQLEWIIRNVTDFWAFVDIGLHNDGLVHKSQMANHYVSNPIEIVSVWQKVSVKVLAIDEGREKVSLTMKDEASQDNKFEHGFKKERKDKNSNFWKSEDDMSSSLKSNITFTKA